MLSTLLLLTLLIAYVVVVEQRAPVLRAGLMTAIVVLAGSFYRRVDLLNSAGLAALILLAINPKSIVDSSFQLSFLALDCIAGVALPWMERRLQPYVRALRGWQDGTRDVSFEPLLVQFRLDLRSACPFVTSRLSSKPAAWLQDRIVNSIGLWFRVSELFVVSLVLQLGMLPLMATDFHRIPLFGPVANLFAVPLTGIIVPMGFFGLAVRSFPHGSEQSLATAWAG
jgi:competence protein ComEC